MLGLGKRDASASSSRKARVLEVGWINRAEQASFIWDDPTPYRRVDGQDPKSAKALQNCPAVHDYEARHFVVPCPFDLNLALARDKDGKLGIRNLDGTQSAVSTSALMKLLHLNGPGQWRHPERPLLQITTPYYFIADEVCWMSQLPPYLTYREPQLPGLVVGGRLPIHIWPRAMIWAFEWHEPAKPLRLRRGEPWFLLRFETDDPSRPVRLVEAEWTSELDAFNKGTEGVTKYIRRTWSLFRVAERRRPAKLLKKVERGQSQFGREVPDES